MDGACSAYGGRGVYRVLVGKPNGKRPLGRPGVDGRIILRWIFREVGCRGVDWIELAQDKDRWQALLNAFNEPSGSVKSGEFLD